MIITVESEDKKMTDGPLPHIHVHTDASLIDGLGTVDRLITAAEKLKLPAIAMTDHGTLTNSIAFSKRCEQDGAPKPILGMEGYIEIDEQTFHLTLLADGNVGFNSLVELNNRAQLNTTRRPAFTVDDLFELNEGVIVLSGCPASPFQSLEYPEALKLGMKFKEVFRGRFFAEVMFVSDQPNYLRSEQLSVDLGIPLVLTNDVHFAYKEDNSIHKILTQLKASFTYSDDLLYLAEEKDILWRANRLGGKSAKEIAARAAANTKKIASKLRPVIFDDKPSLPEIKDAEQVLRRKVMGNLLKMVGDCTGPVEESPEFTLLKERAEYELDIINTLGFPGYFLILDDIVQYAKSENVRIGPGRGSGAGSLVLYSLGITDVNPMKFGLSFERFLNPHREGMPDVDVDFDSEGRHKVIDYAIRRWDGHPVATYSRYSHKMLVHDLSKFFRVPRDMDAAAADAGPDSEEFQKIVNMRPEFLKAYETIHGQIRHIGKHAGGVIITDTAVPLQRASGGSGDLVAAWTEGDEKELTSAGIVKYDFLGLSALSALKILEDTTGKKPEEPVDDHEVFEIFRTGELSGIFQFSGSEGIINFTKQVAPNRFIDLAIINALYRPGTLDSGSAFLYPTLKKKKKVRKFDPKIDPILKETRGIIVYQEQVMELYSTMTGSGLAGADLARRTISKSKFSDPASEVKRAELRKEFHEQASANGFSDEIIEKVWAEIITHARYSFNKSHTIAYAKIAWEMAWWKYYYPAEFYAAMMSVDPGNVQRYIFDVVKAGLEIVPPHINISTDRYEVDERGRIVIPLAQVKYLGERGVKEIVDSRPFKSIEDFMSRVQKRAVNGRARASLWMCNAFEGLEGTKEDLSINIDEDPMEDFAVINSIKYLGMLIPSSTFMDLLDTAENKGLVFGIVDSIEKRKSDKGEYHVYSILPGGRCWSREPLSVEKHTIVQANVDKRNGRIKAVVPLDI